MRRAIALALSAASLLLAACGESDEDKAKTQVCDARADIKKHVDDLNGLTITSASVDEIQQDLQAIGDDLTKISDAQGDLAPDRKEQVEAANKAFRSEVQATAKRVVSGLTAGDAQAQLESAVGALVTGYKKAFAPVDCS
jgi:hypothetical protein